MSETPRSSCYVFYVELDAPGGSARRETFVYTEPAHVMNVLRQELEGKLLGHPRDAIDAICVRGQTMTLGVVQAGTLVMAIDVRSFVSVRGDDGESARVDEVEAEWADGDDQPRRLGASGREASAREAALVALTLDEHAILEALPELDEPRLGRGQSTKIATQKGESDALVLALAKQLRRGLTYGYGDASGDFVSRETFVDPDPPAADDVSAWLAQSPSARTAIAIAEHIAKRGDRELAMQWVGKARKENLPVTAIEAVLRRTFAVESGAPPLREAIRRVDVDPEALADPRWSALSSALAMLPSEGTTATEERLRVISRETDDASVAVIALMLRRHLGRGRGTAHSALMLKQALQRTEETVLPGVMAGEELGDEEPARALEALRESARRLVATGGELSKVDEVLMKLLPTSFDLRRIERAAAQLAKVEEWRGAAAVAALADRVVSDPDDVCAVACDVARLSLKAGIPEDASRMTERALEYWRAHAWMRPGPPNVCLFWSAAARAAMGDRSELDALLARAPELRALARRELEPAAEPAPVVEVEADDGSIRAGHRVAHVKFGEGIVERVEGSGDATKLAVRFDGGESKVLLARFLRRV